MFSSLSAVTLFPFISSFCLLETLQQSGFWVCNQTFQEGRRKWLPSLRGNVKPHLFLLPPRQPFSELLLPIREKCKSWRQLIFAEATEGQNSIWRKLAAYRDSPQDGNAPFSCTERTVKIPKTQCKLYSKQELKSMQQVVALMPRQTSFQLKRGQKIESNTALMI